MPSMLKVDDYMNVDGLLVINFILSSLYFQIDLEVVGYIVLFSMQMLYNSLLNRYLFLSSPMFIPCPQMPYVIRAWWTSSTGYEADHESPRKLVTITGW